MTKIFRLSHDVKFDFSKETRLGSQVLALTPLSLHGNRLLSQTLTVEPRPQSLRWINASEAGRSALVKFIEPLCCWSFSSTLFLRRETTDSLPFKNRLSRELDENTENFPFRYDASLRLQLQPYFRLPDAHEDLVTILNQLPTRHMPLTEALDLIIVTVVVHRILRERQESEEAGLVGVAGARLLLLAEVLQALHLAVRFVQGYDLEREGEFTTWLQIYVPGSGWVDLDSKGVQDPDFRLAINIARDLETLGSQVFQKGQHRTTFYQVDYKAGRKEVIKIDTEAKSESMAIAGLRLDSLLRKLDLNISTHIQVTNRDYTINRDYHKTILDYERNFDKSSGGDKSSSWPDLIERLDMRLKQGDGKTESSERTGRYTLHYISGALAIKARQQSLALGLAFPSLSRLIGKERFVSPYSHAKDELMAACSQAFDAKTRTAIAEGRKALVFKSRHDLSQPFHVLPNALLERLILARMANSEVRFSPCPVSLLEDSLRLPAYLWADLENLCRFVSDEKLRIEPTWFHAHLEHNYPVLWSCEFSPKEQGVNLGLAQIKPFPVSPVSIASPVYREGEGIAVTIRPGYCAPHEEHRFFVFEISLGNDPYDRYGLAVNGWFLPLHRHKADLSSRVSGIRLPRLEDGFDLILYDSYDQKQLLHWQLKIKTVEEEDFTCPGLKEKKETLEEERVNQGRMNQDQAVVGYKKLLAPVSDPEHTHILDFSWARYWS